MSSLKIKKSHSKIECPCKNCQDIKHLGYYYQDYLIELTQKINKLDLDRDKEIKEIEFEIEFEIKKGKNVSHLNLEIQNIKKNYDILINCVSEGYFWYYQKKIKI